MTGPLVMLRQGIAGPFRRTVWDDKGGVVEQLVFHAGQPQQLTDQQCRAVARDIGNALLLVEIDKSGRPRVDHDETAAVRAMLDGKEPSVAAPEPVSEPQPAPAPEPKKSESAAVAKAEDSKKRK